MVKYSVGPLLDLFLCKLPVRFSFDVTLAAKVLILDKAEPIYCNG